MNQRLLDEVRSLVSDVLQQPLTAITAASSSENVSGWDSIRHLDVILALEERYSISIDPYEAAELASVEAIVRTLVERGAAGA
jgi:acyl carrier protein